MVHEHRYEHEPMNWWVYVTRVTGGASTSTIAQRTGLNQSSVTRWRNTGPSVAGVRAFALGYERPILEAFLAAEFLTTDELLGSREALAAFLFGMGDSLLRDQPYKITRRGE